MVPQPSHMGRICALSYSLVHPRRHFGSRCTDILSFVFTMAASAPVLTTSRYVLSPCNLPSFLKWAATATEAELDAVMPEIYIIEHNMGSESDSEFGPPPAPRIDREDLHRVWVLSQRMCTDLYCMRCRSGRGGYKFPWIGPWTCPTIVGDDSTPPAELYRRASECHCGLH